MKNLALAQLIPISIVLLLMGACERESQNLTPLGEDIFTAIEINRLPDSLALKDTVYVPIYSDIYSQTKESRYKLTATLSLRNTSLKYPIFISAVDYYNSAGPLTKHFLEKPIVLNEMESIEYVIEEQDISGGTGANFVIYWAAENQNVLPIFEGIMISTYGQQGISFSTKGVSISGR